MLEIDVSNLTVEELRELYTSMEEMGLSPHSPKSACKFAGELCREINYYYKEKTGKLIKE